MYSGKMTNELKQLCIEYKAKYGYDVSGVMDLEYDDYTEYVKDIQKSLATGVPLPDLYPENDDEF